MGTGWEWVQRLWGWSGDGFCVHGDVRGWGSVSVPVQTSTLDLANLRGPTSKGWNGREGRGEKRKGRGGEEMDGVPFQILAYAI